MRLLLSLAMWGWPVSLPPRAEAFSKPSAQPVDTQWCVFMCRQKANAYMCLCDVISLCPIYFSSLATPCLLFTTLAFPSHIVCQLISEVSFLLVLWSNR